jgi:putative transport protein
VFLTLALGFGIGLLKIGSFKLGPMLGCLFAGMIIGQLDIEVAPVVKLIFFDLFLFATGYKVGPQFFYGLKKDAIPQLALTVIICTSCLAAAVIMSKVMHYDVGTASGLLAGAFTESTVIGTATDAILRLPISTAEKQAQINAIPIAYAVTYLIGTSALVWFLSNLAPKMLGINLKDEAKALAKKLNDLSETSDLSNSAYMEWTIRAFRITNPAWIGRTVDQIEKSIQGSRILIERIRQNGKILEPKPGLVIQTDDVLVIAARQETMLEKLDDIGEEVHDRELLDFPMQTMDIVITRKSIIRWH